MLFFVLFKLGQHCADWPFDIADDICLLILAKKRLYFLPAADEYALFHLLAVHSNAMKYGGSVSLSGRKNGYSMAYPPSIYRNSQRRTGLPVRKQYGSNGQPLR